mgnify:CR=1 FL=1
MLYLASRSPRRHALLEQIGLDPVLLEVSVTEVRQPGEPALDYVNRVAREKAGAGLLAVVGVPGALVLAADTEVILDDEVLGKPADAAAAACMLRRLSGRTHGVCTVVWLVHAGGEASARVQSEVTFSPLSDATLAAYLDSDEWQGKAGAYAIQGRAAAFIAHLSGSYSGVMGLPLFETASLLRAQGVFI